MCSRDFVRGLSVTHLIMEVTAPAGYEVGSMWPEQGAQENPLESLFALVNGSYNGGTEYYFKDIDIISFSLT